MSVSTILAISVVRAPLWVVGRIGKFSENDSSTPLPGAELGRLNPASATEGPNATRRKAAPPSGVASPLGNVATVYLLQAKKGLLLSVR
jgi:hypothetical protein